MNHYKGPPAPELKIVPKGDGRFLVVVNEGQGDQHSVAFMLEAQEAVRWFMTRHCQYKPNVPVGA